MPNAEPTDLLEAFVPTMLRYIANSTRPLRHRLGLTRQTVDAEAPAGGMVSWRALWLWMADVTRSLRRRLRLVRTARNTLELGGEDELPLGLDHRVFARHLDGEHRLKAWQAFSHEFWDRAGPVPSADHLAFLFRRGFHPDRWWTYRLEKRSPDLYLSDLQGLLLHRVNGIYAPVLDNRLLLRRAMAHYCQVPEAWFLLSQDGKGLEMSPTWRALWSKDTCAEPVSVLVQPMDASCRGRTGVFRIHRGQFEGGDRRGSLKQLLALVRTWSLSAGSPYLFSELIEQSDFARDLFPDATNRLHVLMLRDPDTWEPHIAAAVLRIGTARSAPLDDFDAGGISACVDLESGKLTRCLMRMPDAPPRSVKTHPDTGKALDGIAVPGWTGITATLLTLFEQSSYLRACSFDFMLCEGRLALVDASPLPDLGALQAHHPLADHFRHLRL